MEKKLFLWVSILTLLPILALAATGKLSGVVNDAGNGEALIGVNVLIEGTTLGASTDLDGYYVILNLPAGIYTISFNYVGYQSVKYENIRIVPDITKRLDVAMQETTIDLGESILVTADRPFFEASATNTVRVLEADEIERMPMKGVNNVVAMNAGVVVADGNGGDLNTATLNVRGGRGNETLIIVDGIPYNDAVYGESAGSVPDAAIEQVSTQLGGFSSKYGSAQSGVINIVTKGGSTKYFGSIEGVTSQELDAFGYNQLTGTLGGPVIPGNRKYDFFLSGEYVKTDDATPRSSGVIIPSAGIDQKKMPDQEGEIIRFVGKLNGKFGLMGVTLSANGSFRDARGFGSQGFYQYVKNNSFHLPMVKEDVLGTSLKLSPVFNETSFMDVIFRYRNQYYHDADGFWKDNILAYGDSLENAKVGVTLRNGDGTAVSKDVNGVFWDRGYVWNVYRKYEIETFGSDLNFTKQYHNHLLELGGTFQQEIVRYYYSNPIYMGIEKDSRSLEERYFAAQNVFYGYDLYGNKNNDDSYRTVSGDTFEEAGPKKPVIMAFYLQDKIEFADFILNIGARWDYFDPSFNRIKDPQKVLGDDGVLTADDYEKAPVESYVSPRIGFAYPVTERTVFHAQYGVFRQFPRYFDLYDSWINMDDLETMDGQGQNLGHLVAEATTQYEFGFKQQIGTVASLDITAYYKNVKNLVNQQKIVFQYGQSTKSVIGSVNSDFGTIKGLAFAFNLRRIGPLSTKLDYTLALSEGTGSSQNGAFVAVFRNPNGESPLAIAPLDFDQRHTLTANLDIRANKGQGGVILENSGVNFVIIYNSGRPYTPVEYVNILAGTSNYGNLTQYVNSAYAAGVFRIDMKVDKIFYLGRMSFVPYLWIQNLLDRENYHTVWQSTGEPDNTAYLTTPEGQQAIRANGEGYASDYKALERNPWNYGLPRIIRLGLRVEF